MGMLPEETTNVTFNTNKPRQVDVSVGVGSYQKITCFSKGKLEKEILDMTSEQHQ